MVQQGLGCKILKLSFKMETNNQYLPLWIHINGYCSHTHTRTLWACTLIKASLQESGLCWSTNTAITGYGGLLCRRQWGCGVLVCRALLVIWGRIMNLNISNQYIATMLGKSLCRDVHTLKCMHTPTRAHTACKLPLVKQLILQPWHLISGLIRQFLWPVKAGNYTRVIPAA